MTFALNFGSGTDHKTFSFLILIPAGDQFSYSRRIDAQCFSFPRAFINFDKCFHIAITLKGFFRRDLSGRKWYLSISFVVSNCKLIPLHLVSLHWKVKDRYEITFGQLYGLKSVRASLFLLGLLLLLAEHVCLSNDKSRPRKSQVAKLSRFNFWKVGVSSL